MPFALPLSLSLLSQKSLEAKARVDVELAAAEGVHADGGKTGCEAGGDGGHILREIDKEQNWVAGNPDQGSREIGGDGLLVFVSPYYLRVMKFFEFLRLYPLFAIYLYFAPYNAFFSYILSFSLSLLSLLSIFKFLFIPSLLQVIGSRGGNQLCTALCTHLLLVIHVVIAHALQLKGGK